MANTVEQVVELLRNTIDTIGSTAVRQWQGVDVNDADAVAVIGISIRNHFDLWSKDRITEGTTPEEFSAAVLEQILAYVNGIDLDALIASESAADENETEFTDEVLDQLLTATWEHRESGTEYELLYITNRDATDERRSEYPLTAVYENTESGEIWSKPLGRFLNSMKRVI